jgi:hypothetical protein
VLTLHVRGLKKVDRIQALGEKAELSICDACAKEKAAELTDYKQRMKKALLPFAGFIAVGGLMFFLPFKVTNFPGMFLLGLGFIGLLNAYTQTKKSVEQLKTFDQDTLLRIGAYRLAEEELPKKYGDNDLTYIPLDEATQKMEAKYLAVAFKLLPQIALQLHETLHPKKEAAEEVKDDSSV